MYYTAVPQRLCFTSASSGCFDDMLFVLAQNLLGSLPAFLPACIHLQPGPESRVWVRRNHLVLLCVPLGYLFVCKHFYAGTPGATFFEFSASSFKRQAYQLQRCILNPSVITRDEHVMTFRLYSCSYTR